jgi:bacteriorhodopsin
MENAEKDEGDLRAYREAEKRVGAKLSFLAHLAVYVVVNAIFIYINLSTSAEYLWFKWPLFGWGAGLFFHALGVLFFLKGTSLKKWMIEKEMNREIK